MASCVCQGSILGLLLFNLYIDDIRHAINFLLIISHSGCFQVSSYEDFLKLQSDLTCAYDLTIKWLNPRKCEAINISKKH